MTVDGTLSNGTPPDHTTDDTVTEKYDLFCSREAAELYATYQPKLSPKVVDMVLQHAPDKDCLVDVGTVNCSVFFTSVF